MIVPMTPDTTTLATPTVSEIWEPSINLDSSSRPSASVPSRWIPPAVCVKGGRFRSARSCAYGSKGASWCTNAALRMAIATMRNATDTILWVQTKLPSRRTEVIASPQHRNAAVDGQPDAGDERRIRGQQELRGDG